MSQEPHARPQNGSWPDPLVHLGELQERRRGFLIGLFVATLLYLVFFLLLVYVVPSYVAKPDKKDHLIEVSIEETVEPEPEPEPEEIVEEEPEGDEPEPEPEPEPPPPPKPVVKLKEKPKAKEPPPEEKAPEEAPPEATEPMDPVNLEGLDASQFVDTEGAPAFKIGMGIETGKTNDTYVDPNRFGKIRTAPGGKGLGYGTKDSDGKGGEGAPGKPCPTKRAKVLTKFKGRYTALAKRRRIEGVVIGLLTVDETGKVKEVKIVKSLGSGLDESATEAFWKFTFSPAEKGCQKVASKVRISHNFTIER